MPTVLKPIPDRVQAGVALLDREVPGWWRKIDPDTLEIYDCSKCVLGQLFGEYVDGLERVDPLGKIDAEAHGFTLEESLLQRFRHLTLMWRERIEARRNTVAEGGAS